MRVPSSLRAGWLMPVLLSGVLLSAGAAQAKPKESKAAPVAASAPAAVAVPGAPDPKLRSQTFADYESQLSSGQKARAADALVAIVNDAALSPFHPEAYAKLGDLLLGLDLPYAATLAWRQGFVLAQDWDGETVGRGVPKAIETAQKVGDISVLQAPFSKNVGLARTEDVRGQMGYLAAREAFRQGSYGLAQGLLRLVKQGDPQFPQAKMLEGIVLNQQSKPETALTSFEAAGKAADKGSSADNKRFLEMLKLNTGRSYYASGNYPRAIQAFASVDRGSEFWPEAQFERAWAHFRIDDVNGTLGLLLSLNTPFFKNYYYPEADLLRIYSMFMICKFPQANTEIDIFRAKYGKLNDALKAWNGHSAEENFDAARKYRKDGDAGALPSMFWRSYATEERFGNSVQAVESADAELKRLKNVAANPFSEWARTAVKARRSELIDLEGSRIRDRIAAQQAQVDTMLNDSQIFTLDIMAMKTKLYEQAAASGKMPDVARTAKRDERVKRTFVEWPYEGEVWADEVGYYKVNTAPECPASLRTSVKGK